MSLHNFYHCSGTTVQIHLEQQSPPPQLTFGSLRLILQDPAGLAVTQHDPSARAASSARGGQCQQDGVEVERQSRLGWDLIQVQSQRNGVSMSGWAMDCEALESPEPRALWLQPFEVDLYLVHLKPRQKMAVISLSLSLSPSQSQVCKQSDTLCLAMFHWFLVSLPLISPSLV